MRSRMVNAGREAWRAGPEVGPNLFGMSVDARLTPADQADLTRLIDLGQPMVVFIAPPPSDDDPNAA